jgi:hypothetical protein
MAPRSDFVKPNRLVGAAPQDSYRLRSQDVMLRNFL